MTQLPPPPTIGKELKSKPVGNWVQTERKAHEAWADLSLRKPRASALLHHLIAKMGQQNAVVVSQKLLAKIMGAHERTVQRALVDLVAEHWIQVVKLNGPGTISAYIVNDRVAWGQPRDELRLSVFSAAVIANAEDQDEKTFDSSPELRRIPMIFSHEMQSPTGDGLPPPSQQSLPGMEPSLPARS